MRYEDLFDILEANPRMFEGLGGVNHPAIKGMTDQNLIDM
jgi:hypothetical protein